MLPAYQLHKMPPETHQAFDTLDAWCVDYRIHNGHNDSQFSQLSDWLEFLYRAQAPAEEIAFLTWVIYCKENLP